VTWCRSELLSDHTACYFDPKGLPIDALLAHTAKHGVLKVFSNQVALDPAELLAQQYSVLVPAALERVIAARMAGQLQCRILAEGANGPTTPEADEVLNQTA
jgi:glutamate dehydrogenase (NAD(P)+)